jgi:hypothetical protein
MRDSILGSSTTDVTSNPPHKIQSPTKSRQAHLQSGCGWVPKGADDVTVLYATFGSAIHHTPSPALHGQGEFRFPPKIKKCEI